MTLGTVTLNNGNGRPPTWPDMMICSYRMLQCSSHSPSPGPNTLRRYLAAIRRIRSDIEVELADLLVMRSS